MMRTTMTIVICLTLSLASSASAQDNPRVMLETSMGAITLELNAKAAPLTVSNFLAYVKSGQYKDTIFHRVIKSFMIQGGGFTQQMQQKKTLAPIENEAHNGLKNTTGTIAMARTRDPHSATSQFFINVKDNSFLDHRSKTPEGWGYCVFGRVVKGMEVVHAIENVPTTIRFGFRDVPTEPVVIKGISVVTDHKTTSAASPE